MLLLLRLVWSLWLFAVAVMSELVLCVLVVVVAVVRRLHDDCGDGGAAAPERCRKGQCEVSKRRL